MLVVSSYISKDDDNYTMTCTMLFSIEALFDFFVNTEIEWFMVLDIANTCMEWLTAYKLGKLKTERTSSAPNDTSGFPVHNSRSWYYVDYG